MIQLSTKLKIKQVNNMYNTITGNTYKKGDKIKDVLLLSILKKMSDGNIKLLEKDTMYKLYKNKSGFIILTLNLTQLKNFLRITRHNIKNGLNEMISLTDNVLNDKIYNVNDMLSKFNVDEIYSML